MNHKKNLKRQWLALLKEHSLYCVLCGQLILNAKDISVEHYIPRGVGGSRSNYNCFPAHRICNEIKGCALPDDWNKKRILRMKWALKHWKLTERERMLLLNIIRSLENER